MKSQWMAGQEGTKELALVASMIRNDELELAQAQMDRMQEDGAELDPWIHVLLIHALVEHKDFEAIMRLVYRLFDERKDLPRATWLAALEQAAEHGHFHLTEWIWMHHVEPMYVKPNAETCVNVLKVFASEIKPKLAESAYGILEVIDPELAKQHTELLEETYTKAGMKREAALHKRPNMFTVFGGVSQGSSACFDPKLALEKRPLQRLTNPRERQRIHQRVERSKAYARDAKARRRLPGYPRVES